MFLNLKLKLFYLGFKKTSMYEGLIFKTLWDKILWSPDIIVNLWF